MTTRKGRTQPQRPGTDPVSAALRKLWEGVEHEPVPPAFLDLLDRIDQERAADQPRAEDRP